MSIIKNEQLDLNSTNNNKKQDNNLSLMQYLDTIFPYIY
jgi:hypothetical protein